MKTNGSTNTDYTKQFAAVQAAESQWLKESRAVNNIAKDAPTLGLAFSGGGIRSASFNLGVLQALAKHGWLSRVDYLSTVSGGGYIGSFYSWIKSQLGKDTPHDIGAIPLSGQDGSVMDWLRDHGKYLINGRGFSVWTLIAAILAGTLLNLIVLLPLFIGVVSLLSADWFALTWPQWLHLPGAPSLQKHDGFMTILCLALLSFAAYFISIFAFVVSSIFPALQSSFQPFLLRKLMGAFLATGFIGAIIGLLPVLTNIEESVLSYTANETWQSISRHLSYLGPFLAGLFTLLKNNKPNSEFSKNNQRFVVVGLSLIACSFFTLIYHLAAHTNLVNSDFFILWCLVSLTLALFCDINAISMHTYYQGRLTEAYFPPITKEQSAASFTLSQLTAQTGNPLHVINTTVNTSSAKAEKLRSRNGESLFLSPLYCGSSSTGYRQTSQYLRGQLTLANAMSVSGAAVDPDTIATRSRAISFLMTLLNIRLGIWVDNPNQTQPRRHPSWYQLLIREMLGVGLSPDQKQIHLSDGGHFENLGIYELLRRRCQYIISCDAGADPQATMSSLAEVIQKARADFGAEIDINTDGLTQTTDNSTHKTAHIIGTIYYADGSQGKLLYLKALVTDNLSADITAYQKTHPAFPNQSTSDQFFDEMQFDSYRELGLQLTSNIISHHTADDIAAIFPS